MDDEGCLGKEVNLRAVSARIYAVAVHGRATSLHRDSIYDARGDRADVLRGMKPDASALSHKVVVAATFRLTFENLAAKRSVRNLNNERLQIYNGDLCRFRKSFARSVGRLEFFGHRHKRARAS